MAYTSGLMVEPICGYPIVPFMNIDTNQVSCEIVILLVGKVYGVAALVFAPARKRGNQLMTV